MSEIQNHTYASKLRKKYGEKFLEDIHSLWTVDETFLNDVAKKHGVTREAIRLIFKKLYGNVYGKLYKKKRLAYQEKIKARVEKEKQKKVDLEWRADNLRGYQGHHAQAQLMVHDVCMELGYKVEVDGGEKHQKPQLVINGYRTIVAWASKPHMAGNGAFKWPYWRFGSDRARWDNFDFAVLCANTDPDILFFIVPKSEIPEGSMIFIRQGKSDYHAAKNRYYPYLGAWHLLERF